MSDKIQIQITATDGASRVFQQVASGAERLDRSLDQVGDGFQDLSQDSEFSAQQLREFDKLGKDIAISLGVLATGMSLAGQSFRDQEVALRTLERGYGDAAAEMEAFAEQIQDTTNFSNDAAIAAANTFRTLSDNYGFTADQIQQLISISADLAATMGIGLSDAAFRVQSAMRGEAEAAEFLGLTLNDRALGLDRVSTSMTEAERAQIRFNALQEQSAFALGTAAEQADTTYGSMTQLRDSVQDAAQSFGEFLGPVGEVGAFAADNAVQIAAMGLAIGQLSSTAKGLNDLAKAMTGVSLASRAMTATPAILGLTVAVGALYVGYEALTQQGDVTSQGLEDLRLNAETLTDQITLLSAAGDTLAVSLGIAAHNALTQAADDVQKMLELTGEQATFQPGRASEEQRAAHEANMERLRELEAQYGSWSGAAEDVAEAEADVLSILQGSGALHDQQLVALQQTNAAYESGALTFEQYLSGLDMVADMTGNVTAATEELTEAQEDHNMAMAIANQTLESYLQNQQIGGQNLAGEHEEAAAAIEKEEAALNTLVTTQQEAIELNTAIQAGQRGVTDSTNDATDALSDMLNVSLDMLGGPFRGAFDEIGRDMFEAAEQARELKQAMVDIATSVPDAVTVLDNVFQSVVGNTDAWAKSSDAVAKWAVELGGAIEHFDEWGNSIGWWSRMDEVVEGWGSTLDAATLSVQEHTAAQQAFATIAEENAEIQQNVAVIQAKQAPLLADQIELTENYTQAIADMGAEQATVALGFMDATQAGRALELQTLAISAASGELGAGGQAFATDIIVGAAQADAQLRMMLESMGLISVGADGTITVNFEDNATGPLEQLQQTMEQLAYTELLIFARGDASEADAMFEDIFGKAADWDGTEATATLGADNADALARASEAEDAVYRYGEATGTAQLYAADNASDTIGNVQGAVDRYGGTIATATLQVSDNATGTISYAQQMLAAFNGSTATAYIQTVDLGVAGQRVALGGVVNNYDTGGVVAEMAEYGPELLHFPNGGVALAAHRGIYTVPQGTYVDTAPATAYKLGSNINFAININGPSSWDDAAEQVSRKIIPAISRAMREHERSLGGY